MADPRGALRGFFLRCPRCAQGKMNRSFFEFHDRCQVCGQRFSPGEGEFTMALMVWLFVSGLLALPIYLIVGLVGLDFVAHATVTAILAILVYVLGYRNVKGAWYGWMRDWEG